MNTQEKATIRKSRESIGALIARFNPESSTVTDLRAVMKMLAPLINGQSPAAAVKPKTVKSTKAKAQPLYLASAHKFGCVCSPSCQRYAADWRAAVCYAGTFKGALPAEVSRKLESVESIRERLTNCACGHSGQHHAEDEIGNLLACDMPNCDCDHFHYEVASIPGAADDGDNTVDVVDPSNGEIARVDLSKLSAADRRELARINASCENPIHRDLSKDNRDCADCSRVWAAKQKAERIILAAFPDLDNRSDSQADHFDYCLSIN